VILAILDVLSFATRFDNSRLNYAIHGGWLWFSPELGSNGLPNFRYFRMVGTTDLDLMSFVTANAAGCCGDSGR
jgi:hypothetical protein